MQSVTVRGWDPTTKKAIVADRDDATTRRASAARPTTTRPGRGQGARRARRREDVVVDAPGRQPTRRRWRSPRRCWPSAPTSSSPANGKVIGLPDLRPGDNVEIHGVGKRFSGTYYVTKVTHTLNAAGYLTEFDARRTDEVTAMSRLPHGRDAPTSASTAS